MSYPSCTNAGRLLEIRFNATIDKLSSQQGFAKPEDYVIKNLETFFRYQQMLLCGGSRDPSIIYDIDNIGDSDIMSIHHAKQTITLKYAFTEQIDNQPNTYNISNIYSLVIENQPRTLLPSKGEVRVGNISAKTSMTDKYWAITIDLPDAINDIEYHHIVIIKSSKSTASDVSISAQTSKVRNIEYANHIFAATEKKTGNITRARDYLGSLYRNPPDKDNMISTISGLQIIVHKYKTSDSFLTEPVLSVSNTAHILFSKKSKIPASSFSGQYGASVIGKPRDLDTGSTISRTYENMLKYNNLEPFAKFIMGIYGAIQDNEDINAVIEDAMENDVIKTFVDFAFTAYTEETDKSEAKSAVKSFFSDLTGEEPDRDLRDSVIAWKLFINGIENPEYIVPVHPIAYKKYEHLYKHLQKMATLSCAADKLDLHDSQRLCKLYSRGFLEEKFHPDLICMYGMDSCVMSSEILQNTVPYDNFWGKHSMLTHNALIWRDVKIDTITRLTLDGIKAAFNEILKKLEIYSDGIRYDVDYSKTRPEFANIYMFLPPFSTDIIIAREMMRSGYIRVRETTVQYFFDYEKDTSKTITDSSAIKEFQNKSSGAKWARKFPLITSEIEEHSINGMKIVLPAMNKSINLPEYLRVFASRTVFSALYGYIFYGVPGDSKYLRADWINIMFPIKKRVGIIMYQTITTYVSDLLRHAPVSNYRPEAFAAIIRGVSLLLESNGTKGVPGINIVKDVNSANPLDQGTKWIPLRDVYDILDNHMRSIKIITENGVREITNYREYSDFVKTEWLSIENKMQKSLYHQVGPHVWGKLPITQAGTDAREERLVVFDNVISSSGLPLSDKAKGDYALLQRDLYRLYVIHQETLNRIYETKQKIADLDMDTTSLVNSITKLLGIVSENVIQSSIGRKREPLVNVDSIKFTPYKARHLTEGINPLIRIHTTTKLGSPHVVLNGNAAYITSSAKIPSNAVSAIGADDFNDIDVAVIGTGKVVGTSAIASSTRFSIKPPVAAEMNHADDFDGIDEGDIEFDQNNKIHAADFDGIDEDIIDRTNHAGDFDGIDEGDIDMSA